MNFRPSNWVWLAIVAIAWGTFPSASPAQDAEPPPIQKRNPLKEATELKSQELQRLMELQIDDLNRLCSLSSEQIVRIRTASKGAVDQSMEKWIERIEANGWLDVAGQVEIALQPNGWPVFPEKCRHRKCSNRTSGKNPFRPFSTSSQKAKRKEEVERRVAFRQNAALNQAVAVIEMELLLSPKQRDEVRDLLSKEMGKRFKRKGKALLNVLKYAEKLPREEMDKILNEHQLARWDDLEKQFSDVNDGIIHFEVEEFGF